MNTPIGIIDSGVGGLSIASEIIKSLPNESILYIGDSKNCPYGQKSPSEIYELSKKMVEYLLKQKIKLLIIACNTISVTCLDKLRLDYPKIPIVGIVPVVKTAAAISKNKKIGIFSTKVTAESDYQKDLIEKFHNDCFVLNLGTSDLVSAIESLDFEEVDRVLAKDLQPFIDAKIDTLALGCSHFPLVKERIQKTMPEVLILDSATAVSHQVKRILEHNNLLSNSSDPSYNFYTTGDTKAMDYFVNKLTSKANLDRILL